MWQKKKKLYDDQKSFLGPIFLKIALSSGNFDKHSNKMFQVFL